MGGLMLTDRDLQSLVHLFRVPPTEKRTRQEPPSPLCHVKSTSPENWIKL
uniref:Uncharacterized protein n=1 Tax=Anguilla anguilla TaxID=7936 RepID=A0A0E9TV84_ANGAN